MHYTYVRYKYYDYFCGVVGTEEGGNGDLYIKNDVYIFL